MSNGNGRARPSVPGKNESLIIGILVGMVLGLAIAGGVAWYLVKQPSPFHDKLATTHDSKPEAEVLKPAPLTQPAPAAQKTAPGTDDGKPRFEFYKILTDKQDGTAAAPQGGGTPAPVTQATAQPATQGSNYFLQAASFTNADDADKLKAKLALLGMEAGVQTATVPGKGMRYRVRLGPFGNTDDLNKANSVLKQNGITDAVPMRAQ